MLLFPTPAQHRNNPRGPTAVCVDLVGFIPLLDATPLLSKTLMASIMLLFLLAVVPGDKAEGRGDGLGHASEAQGL